MKKQTIALLLAAQCGLMLAGCGAGESAETEAATTAATEAAASSEETEASQETDTESRSIIVGTSGTSDKYSVLDDEGNWTGVDADIWKEIEERTGWDVEIKQVDFAGTWGELDSGRIDIASNYWAVNDERKEKYCTSIPYASDVQVVVVPEDRTDLNTFEDIRGAKVSVAQGQSAQFMIQAIADQYDFDVIVYESDALQDLLLGRVDATASSITYVQNYCDTHGVKVHQLEEDLSKVNVGMYAQKTEEGEALMADINAVLQEMLDDGTIAEITEKYLDMDMTEFIMPEDGAADTEEAETSEEAAAVEFTDRSLTIGTVGGSNGYSVYSGEGSDWTGVDGELWKAIVERTGWDIEIKQVDFASTWGELDTGRIDIASNFWAINDTRKEKYSVSIPYASDIQLIAVPEDRTDINTLEDLRGAKIAVFQGQSALYTLQSIADQYDFDVIVYEDAYAAMQDMLLGRVDAYAANITFFELYEKNFGTKVHTLEEELSHVNVGLYAQKTEEGQALIDEINIVLQELLDDGTISAICDEWLGVDLTQYITEE